MNTNQKIAEAAFKLGFVDTGVTDVRLIETVEMLIEVIRDQQRQIDLLNSKTAVEGFGDGN